MTASPEPRSFKMKKKAAIPPNRTREGGTGAQVCVGVTSFSVAVSVCVCECANTYGRPGSADRWRLMKRR